MALSIDIDNGDKISRLLLPAMRCAICGHRWCCWCCCCFGTNHLGNVGVVSIVYLPLTALKPLLHRVCEMLVIKHHVCTSMDIPSAAFCGDGNKYSKQRAHVRQRPRELVSAVNVSPHPIPSHPLLFLFIIFIYVRIRASTASHRRYSRFQRIWPDGRLNRQGRGKVPPSLCPTLTGSAPFLHHRFTFFTMTYLTRISLPLSFCSLFPFLSE